MLDVPRQKLCELLTTFGLSLRDDASRCEGLLRDVCAQHPREIHLLVSAVRQKVPAELLAASGREPLPAIVVRLTRKLQQNLAMEESAARWAVESWAIALQLMPPGPGEPAAVLPPTPEPAYSSTAAAGISSADDASVWDTPAVPASPVPASAPAAPHFPPAAPEPLAPAPPVPLKTRGDSSVAAWTVAAVLGAISLVAITVVVVLLFQSRPAASGVSAGNAPPAASTEVSIQSPPPDEVAPPPVSVGGEEPTAAPPLAEGNPPAPVEGGSAPVELPAGDSLTQAQELLRRGDSRRSASDAMMEQHRQARVELENAVGPDSRELDNAYTDYPHEYQITAYERMAKEAGEDAEAVGKLALSPEQAQVLTDYLNAQRETYQEIRDALDTERRSGYTAARPLWDRERDGVYKRAAALRDQADSLFSR